MAGNGQWRQQIEDGLAAWIDAERRNLGLAKAALAELPRALQDVFVHRWYAAAETKDGDEKARGLIDHLDGRKDLVPETAFGGAEVSQSFREWC